MTRSQGTGLYFGDPAVLPPGVEELLVDVVDDGFALYCCGDRAAPSALVACYEWDHYLDVISIQNFDRITTARLPRRGTVDPFTPDVVVWAYEGPPEQALRALLNRCTLRIPTPRSSAIRRRQACTSHVPGNARWPSAFPRQARSEPGMPGSPPP